VKVKQLVTTSLLSFCCVVCPQDKRFDLEERHFALMEISAIPTKARWQSFSGQKFSIRPMRLFGPQLRSELLFRTPLCRGAERPINYSVFYCTPSRCPRCPTCEPNYNLIVVPFLAHHPIQSNTGELLISWPWRLWRSFAHVAPSRGGTDSAILESYGSSVAPPLPLIRSAAENFPAW
jgi:hypothetical protein